MTLAFLTQDRTQQPKVGISACLAGENVRYDGGNKLHLLIQQELMPWLNFQKICPEVEANLGVPRPPIQLIEKSKRIQVLGVEDKTLNATHPLTQASQHLVKKYCHGMSAYIVKARSPSCGADSTPIYAANGVQQRVGNGIFVEVLKATFPHIIVVEENTFKDIEVCKNFLEQCYQFQNRAAELQNS